MDWLQGSGLMTSSTEDNTVTSYILTISILVISVVIYFVFLQNHDIFGMLLFFILGCMSLLTEEQIQQLRSTGTRFPDVNETCIGCSACVAISGDVFELNDEWKSVVRQCDSYEWKEVDDAILACPVDAISWKE